jgi:shikimate dehydrogenase
MPDLHLGLIGDNISRSRSPLLHRLAGAQNGMDVQYDRLIPRDLGTGFDEIFEGCPDGGFHGINVTYPYKERAAKRVTVGDPLVRAIGAVNTVLFGGQDPQGFNTDYSGFIAAYRAARTPAPDVSCLIGTGGVGRALAFGLVALEASEIRLVDRDIAKAEALAEDLRAAAPAIRIATFADAAEAAKGAQGLLNGTPVGMVGYDGTPLAAEAMQSAEWAFDAVYTPVETQFLTDATKAGLDVISGYELFFWQGVHAWEIFSGGRPLDQDALRASLESGA